MMHSMPQRREIFLKLKWKKSMLTLPEFMRLGLELYLTRQLSEYKTVTHAKVAKCIANRE